MTPEELIADPSLLSSTELRVTRAHAVAIVDALAFFAIDASPTLDLYRGSKLFDYALSALRGGSRLIVSAPAGPSSNEAWSHGKRGLGSYGAHELAVQILEKRVKYALFPPDPPISPNYWKIPTGQLLGDFHGALPSQIVTTARVVSQPDPRIVQRVHEALLNFGHSTIEPSEQTIRNALLRRGYSAGEAEQFIRRMM